MRPASLALALFLFAACIGTLTASTAASIKFPYASVEGPARYAGWVPTYTAATTRSDLHRVTLYLTPSNPALLDDMFWAVSDPESPQYAKYLTTDEITKIVSPAPEAVKSVVDWLHQQGAATVEVARNRDAIVAMMPVHRVEAAFAVSLRRFVSPDGHRQLLRSSQKYSVPAHIASHIDLVSGLTDFPPVGSGKKSLIEAAAASTVPSSAALTPSVPVVTMVRARGGNQLLINFTPVCANGQYTKDAKKPCSEAAPAIAGFYVQINSTNPAVGKSKSEWLDSQCTFNGNYTTCTGSVKAWLYDALNVSVAAAFENDHVGPSGYNPYPVLATPPIVPQNIWKQYNIPPNTLVTTNVTQCVVEFEQQYYSPSDLTLFLEQTGLPTDTPVTVIGPNYPNQPGGEANLDIQYIMGVAPGAPTVFWSIYANSTVEIDDILQWALQMSKTDNPPQVNSLSYGMTEVNVDKYLGKGYLARADFEFKKLALRGITIIIASGDTGAGDLGDEPMAVPNCNTLHADWPSQSAYVTSVSSTIITPAAEPICYQQGVDCLDGPLGEIVVSVDQGLFWTTGGGFSNISARAPYQAQEVERYLNHKSITFPTSGVWNPNGRAYPDVSAVGHNLMVALSGKFIPVDGTSASAPIFAGVVTLLNDARAAAGLPPLGFLNPMLYKARRERPQTFYDVTWGNNRCGALGFDPVCCPHGYHATDGWDAASGLGTPNFLELKEFVLQYPKAH